MQDVERNWLSVHEAGHAVVAAHLGRPAYRVRIWCVDPANGHVIGRTWCRTRRLGRERMGLLMAAGWAATDLWADAVGAPDLFGESRAEKDLKEWCGYIRDGLPVDEVPPEDRVEFARHREDARAILAGDFGKLQRVSQVLREQPHIGRYAVASAIAGRPLGRVGRLLDRVTTRIGRLCDDTENRRGLRAAVIILVLLGLFIAYQVLFGQPSASPPSGPMTSRPTAMPSATP